MTSWWPVQTASPMLPIFSPSCSKSAWPFPQITRSSPWPWMPQQLTWGLSYSRERAQMQTGGLWGSSWPNLRRPSSHTVFSTKNCMASLQASVTSSIAWNAITSLCGVFCRQCGPTISPSLSPCHVFLTPGRPASSTNKIIHVPVRLNVVANLMSRPPQAVPAPWPAMAASVKVPSGSLAVPR